MIASVHVVDSAVLANVRRRAPKPATVPGMRWSRKALCGELSPGMTPAADLRRGAMVAWWDDDESLDVFLADDPRARAYDAGWTVRLQPVRGRASWPKAEFDPMPVEPIQHGGIHAAATLGSARVRKVPGFFKVSGHLEQQFLDDAAGIWGLAITMPPRMVMTLTFWESAQATDAFVRSGAHGAAMKDHYDFPTDTHDYVADGGFFGFRPYAMQGRLTGKNPTPAAFDSVANAPL